MANKISDVLHIWGRKQIKWQQGAASNVKEAVARAEAQNDAAYIRARNRRHDVIQRALGEPWMREFRYLANDLRASMAMGFDDEIVRGLEDRLEHLPEGSHLAEPLERLIRDYVNTD